MDSDPPPRIPFTPGSPPPPIYIVVTASVLFLLQNVTQCCEFFLNFSSLGIPLPTFLSLTSHTPPPFVLLDASPPLSPSTLNGKVEMLHKILY